MTSVRLSVLEMSKLHPFSDCHYEFTALTLWALYAHLVLLSIKVK